MACSTKPSRGAINEFYWADLSNDFRISIGLLGFAFPWTAVSDFDPTWSRSKSGDLVPLLLLGMMSRHRARAPGDHNGAGARDGFSEPAVRRSSDQRLSEFQQVISALHAQIQVKQGLSGRSIRLSCHLLEKFAVITDKYQLKQGANGNLRPLNKVGSPHCPK